MSSTLGLELNTLLYCETVFASYPMGVDGGELGLEGRGGRHSLVVSLGM